MKNELPIDCAIRLLGGVVAAAKALNLKSYQVLQQWAKTQVPYENCSDIEIATGGQVTCEQLRPDIAEKFAYLRSTGQKAA